MELSFVHTQKLFHTNARFQWNWEYFKMDCNILCQLQYIVPFFYLQKVVLNFIEILHAMNKKMHTLFEFYEDFFLSV